MYEQRQIWYRINEKFFYTLEFNVSFYFFFFFLDWYSRILWKRYGEYWMNVTIGKVHFMVCMASWDYLSKIKKHCQQISWYCNVLNFHLTQIEILFFAYIKSEIFKIQIFDDKYLYIFYLPHDQFSFLKVGLKSVTKIKLLDYRFLNVQWIINFFKIIKLNQYEIKFIWPYAEPFSWVIQNRLLFFIQVSQK